MLSYMLMYRLIATYVTFVSQKSLKEYNLLIKNEDTAAYSAGF